MLKTIPKFENYAITRDGQVWSKCRYRWLKLLETKEGRLIVHLGNGNTKFVHRLVLETFIGPCPEGMETCHNNNNPKDNRLENLRWDTRSNNVKDAIKYGTANCVKCGESSSYHKLIERDVRMIIYMYRTGDFTQREIGEIYSVTKTNIGHIINKKTWKHIWSK